eukprot:jgi/Botrbrau1/5853/Bobra.0366s0034.1
MDRESENYVGESNYDAMGTFGLAPWRPESAGGTRPENSEQVDFDNLVEACCSEDEREAFSSRKASKKRLHKLTRGEAARAVDDLLEYSHTNLTRDFRQRLAEILEESGVEWRDVTVEYRDITVEVDATMGTGSIPNLYNILWAFFKRLFGMQRGTRRLRVLSNLHGKLKPRRLTLLQGPPGSGKSTFMKVIAGRLEESSFLRMTGDITWNGRHADEFVLPRSAALVPQQDDHIATLTVRETLEFAEVCQLGRYYIGFNVVEEIMQARQRNQSLTKQVARLSRSLSNATSQELDRAQLGLTTLEELENNASNFPESATSGRRPPRQQGPARRDRQWCRSPKVSGGNGPAALEALRAC